MVKKLNFTLLFTLFVLTFTPVFALSEHAPETDNIEVNACNAPPPDSFRIRSIGSSFVTLDWIPAWNGADHQLSVYIKNTSGDWDSLDTYFSIPDAHYTVHGLEPGSEYRFKIATKCTNGDPSELSAFVDGIVLIIDLAVSGRTPLHPVAVNCEDIPLNHEWIGFMIECNTCRDHISTLFEINTLNVNNHENNSFSEVQIKRVETNAQIVAVDEGGFWPTISTPILVDVWNPFRVDHLIPGTFSKEIVGFVEFEEWASNLHVCADYDNHSKPWNKIYQFTALTAENVVGGHKNSNRTDLINEDSLLFNNKFRAQTPFNNNMNVFVPASFSKSIVSIKLLNINGQPVLDQQFEIQGVTFSFPVQNIPSGIYFLQINSEGIHEMIKVVKTQ